MEFAGEYMGIRKSRKDSVFGGKGTGADPGKRNRSGSETGSNNNSKIENSKERGIRSARQKRHRGRPDRN
ncbi:MAG: hypothetical protein K2N98_03045, partial [Lachnospiraceae bacterium]|nr:hypothetical protein [Lachnospiraceae bacterium]